MTAGKGPYFAVTGGHLGFQVRLQYGPTANDSDFVETYSSRKAAQKDAETMNGEWTLRQEAGAVTAEPDFDALYERQLDEKAAKDADPREEGWL